jgi:hypothetical protein
MTGSVVAAPVFARYNAAVLNFRPSSKREFYSPDGVLKGGGGLDRWLKPQEEQTAAVDVRGDLRKQWEAEARQKGYTDEAIQAYIDNKQKALDEASQKEVDARNTAQEEKLHADA